jgi:hypothetical protein
MADTKLSSTQKFMGMDTDSILERVEENWYIDGENFRIYAGSDGNAGALRELGGTLEVPWDVPATGANTGLGCFWDERGNTLVVFVHNSDNQHSILWVHMDETSARTITSEAFNFSSGTTITGVTYLENGELIFTDGADYIKCLNLDRAHATDKRSVVRVYLPPRQGVVVDSRAYAVRLLLDGVPQGISFPLVSSLSQSVWDFFPMMDEFAASWNANATLRAKFKAHGCADYIELEAQQAGMWSVSVIVTDTVGGTPEPQQACVVEYWNRYNDAFTREQVTLSTVAPSIAPSVVMARDSERKTNFVRRRNMQFAYGYRLKDKRHTLTSPISDIALPPVSTCQNGNGVDYNCVDVTFGDRWLTEVAMRGEIEYVDLYMRDGNNGSWSLIKTLEKWEWMYSRSYRFFNDQSYAAADQSFVEAGSTFLPPIANALELISDINNNQRVTFGGITEGDDNPCVTVVPTVFLDGDVSVVRGTAKVTADIYIKGAFDVPPFEYNANQPILVYGDKVVYGGMGRPGGLGPDNYTPDPEVWGQEVKMGGFLGYMAGTDKYGISMQVVPIVPVFGGSNSPSLWAAPTGSPAAGRNVYDGTNLGNHPFTPANDTGRAAIRNAMEAVAVYSRLEIGGLVPGETYVLRLASPLCEKLGDGSLYDLDNPSLDWQKTSCRVVQVGSVVAANIKPGRFECTVTIPSGSAGQTIHIGDIIVVDATNPQFITGSFVNDGWLYDNLGDDNGAGGRDIRDFGVPAEKQLVAFRNYPTVGSPTVFPGNPISSGCAYLDDLFNGYIACSDHNGYFFFFQQNGLDVHPRAAWLGVGGNPSSPVGMINSFGLASINVTDFTVMNDVNASKWEGTIEPGSVLTPVSGNLFNGPGTQSYIFANLDDGVHMRTHIRARMVDIGGSPVQGIVAILESGRVVTSDTLGEIDLIAYGDAYFNNNDRSTLTGGDRLVLRENGPCTVNFPGGSTMDVLITQFEGGAQYCETPDVSPYPNHYILGDILAVVTGLGSGRGWMRGAVHPVGYFLKRWNGDRTAVKWIGDVRIPLLTEDLHDLYPILYPAGTFSAGVGRLRIDILGDVPRPWIGRWDAIQVVVGDDTTREWSVQWLASSVTYSSIWNDSADEPTPTSYGGGTATEIYIELTDSFTRYQQVNTDSTLGYLWERDDMLRILTNQNGVPIYGNVVEVEIGGQRDGVGAGQVGKWIVIKADSRIPQLFGGELIEIYTPRKPVATSIATYYELQDGLVAIGDPWGTPFWTATSIVLNAASGWLIPTNVPILTNPATELWQNIPVVREAIWRSDLWDSTSWGKGKPWFANADAQVERRGGLMRYTEAYKPGTNINGLNLCGGLSYRLVEGRLGDIMVMRRIQDVIFCVCENGAFSIYVGVQQQQTTPAALLETVGGILGNVRPFAHKHGTRHPLSVVRGATTIVYFDWTNGAYVQYNSNELGDRAAQERMHAWFTRKSAALPDGANVCGGWDMPNGMFMCSFPVVAETEYGEDGLPVERKVPAETMMYHDDANKFISRLVYHPDCWGTTRQRLWSFKDGRLLLHDAPGAEPNMIDGVKLQVSVTPAFVGSETMLKQPTVLWLGRGGGWEVSRVTASDEGQLSRIPAGDFQTLRGKVSKAPFYKDSNTPHSPLTLPTLSNGDPLMATAFAVELRFVGPGRCRMLNATMFYLDVTPTN